MLFLFYKIIFRILVFLLFEEDATDTFKLNTGAIDEAAEAGTFVDVRVVAPYTNITKGKIAEIGKKLGIDYAETWSCYKGGEKHCGKCGTCVERKEALAEAGIEDTTEYEE